MSTEAKKYFTPEQLSARWEGAVTVGTLANWRARKLNPGPPHTKLGGKVLYPVAQVEAWEASNTNTKAKDAAA